MAIIKKFNAKNEQIGAILAESVGRADIMSITIPNDRVRNDR